MKDDVIIWEFEGRLIKSQPAIFRGDRWIEILTIKSPGGDRLSNESSPFTLIPKELT